MPVGLILAGGTGTRLGGVRKSDLRLGNRPLWQWAARRLGGQAKPILLSVASETQPIPADLIALPDAPGGLTGPAAGLLAGARWCAEKGEELLVSVAVDTPLFPLDFVSRAQPSLAGNLGCVVGEYGGRDYPTNALWHVPALFNALEGEVRGAKGPRLRDIATKVGAVPCGYDDSPFNPFAGLNTVADLLALSTIVGQCDGSA